MTLAEALVLIVDDNPFNLRLLTAVVHALGISRVETASNGREGLEAVARNRPDIILLDVMMPEMNGLDMCRTLRRTHGTDTIPILFVTALDTPESRNDCFAAGGTDMVGKPINVPEVSARLKVHLENRALLSGLQAYQTRMSEELEMARATLETLRPDPVRLDHLKDRLGIEIAGHIEPSSELGGDFWTVFETHHGRLGLLVADFTGHGVPAALNTARLHALMSRLPLNLSGPTQLLAFLNRHLHQLLRPGQFAAALAVEIDPETGDMAMAGAMPPPPILLDGNGRSRVVDVSGPPLGAFEDACYTETRLLLPRGGVLIAHSDALVEGLPDGHTPEAAATPARWAEEIGARADLVAGLSERFHHLVPGSPPDDLTVVTLRRC